MRTRISRFRAAGSSTPRALVEHLTRRQALALAASPLVALSLPRLAAADDVVTLPASLDVGGRPTVLANIRGHLLRFLVDTGSTRSVLDRAVATELALDLRQSNLVARGLAGPMPVEVMVGPGIEIDGLKPRHSFQRLWVLATEGFGPGVVGLLGNEFLWDWDVEFDLAHGALRFHDPGGAMPFEAQSTALLRHSDRYRIIVQIELDGVVLRALLDSGAAFSSVARRALRGLDINADDGASNFVGMTRGIGSQKVRVENRRFRSFRFEGEQVEAPRLGILEDAPDIRRTTGSNLVTEADHEFVLGADWLNAHRVLLMPGRDRLAFARVDGVPVFRVPVPPRQG